ncbi:MAG: hypothetical protein JWO05_1735 [Gemmatimonadetes bacterium]|nr:hypothetical protein [Gemmatimonadota bacterium]
MSESQPPTRLTHAAGGNVPVGMPAFGPAGVGPAAFGRGGDSFNSENPLRPYFLALLRYWWLVLVAGGLSMALTWRKVRNDAPVFLASASIRITDPRPALTGNLAGEVAGGSGGWTDPVLTQIQVLRSRALAETVVDSAGLRLQSGTKGFYFGFIDSVSVSHLTPNDSLFLGIHRDSFTARFGKDTATGIYGLPFTISGIRFILREPPPWPRVTLRVLDREGAIDRLLGGIDARPRELTTVIDVNVTAPDPVLAQRSANALANTFQYFNAQSAQQQSRRRREFIQRQLQQTDRDLRDAEAALSSYRRGARSFSAKDKYAIETADLTALQKRHDDLTAMLASYQALLGGLTARDASRESIRTLPFSPEVAINTSVATLYQELQRLDRQRDSLTSGPFPRTSQHPEVRRVDAIIESTQLKLLTAVRSQIASIQSQLAGVDTQRDRGTSSIATLPAEEETEVRLTRNVDNVRKLADRLNEELQLAKINEAVETGQVEIVDLSRAGIGPLGKGRRQKLVLAFVIGLGFGAVAAILLDRLNSSVRRVEELESIVRAPTLAVIPQFGTETSGQALSRSERLRARLATIVTRARPSGMVPSTGESVGRELVAINDIRSVAAEAYRKLMTNLLYTSARPGLRTIVVASATSGEGKTTTAANLAVTFAQQGRRVILIDGDLRRARQHEVFGMPLEPGLTDFLIGNVPIERAIRATDSAGLSLIPAGKLPPNPLEFLAGDRMRELLVLLRERFDVVIIDTPPILATADASVLATFADGVVLVTHAGKTQRQTARLAAEQLRTVGARFLGAVLNDPDARTPKYDRYGGYYAAYGYNAT